MGTLTVRENIAFSAALRLSSRYNEKDRRQKVNHVISELGLTHVADSKVTSLLRTVHTLVPLKLYVRLEQSL